MKEKYSEYKGLDLPKLTAEIQENWKKHSVFQETIDSRKGQDKFVFYEGPPSANGIPGIHHVMGRTIKDVFCRYKTLKGFQVERKAGWDTHGLPVELGVEKELGITKDDIGTKISVEEYNTACKNAVMRYTSIWNDLTLQMGYWVDMENPYVTYTPKYMESVWWLIGQLYEKNLLYKGYTIQPYSPKAGTGLSSHELNQPGCYQMVKDTSIIAQFEWLSNQNTPFGITEKRRFFLAWTTTPWTLPSNTALTVGANIEYSLVATFNPYTYEPIEVVLATALMSQIFNSGFLITDDISLFSKDEIDPKSIPYCVINKCVGEKLIGIKYQQLLPYCLPAENPENAFRVISGDFVTTDEGTGIVHTAPTFGVDDARVAKEAGVPAMLVSDENGNLVPIVDLKGKFRPEVGSLGNKFVKNEYYEPNQIPEKSVDVEIAIDLKEKGLAFRVEKYEHSYPHCWRTDKPILYYPLDSWFVKVSEHREMLVALNNKINWKPDSTGTGRFGKWLENANDWNLSRSRYWGIPIPIWRTEDGEEQLCISSIEQLSKECEKSVQKGLMIINPLSEFILNDMSEENYGKIDLHKNFVDKIILVSSKGLAMHRESDLIDVWFDSGSMPYAQWHYPFENKDKIDLSLDYPADFIAEGVDQTRGWFYTLHVISSLVFGKPAYKNVISNGLVLDKNGQKMSKRLGNGVDPFKVLNEYGADACRWYMISNSQPWDNLKFDVEGIKEIQRKFFGTLYNTYSFFALYANIDGFDFQTEEISIEKRPEMDRWIISKLNSLKAQVTNGFEEYESTRAARLIQDFVNTQLSNWYVRLCRRRFWKSDNPFDKLCAYQTLYNCLECISILSAPIAPFFMDRLYLDLNRVSKKNTLTSVHLSNFPEINVNHIDLELESQMDLAQRITSLVLGLRKKEKIRVRQPLQRIMIPVLDVSFKKQMSLISDLIKSEVNVKTIELIEELDAVLVKQIKPNFKTIGPKYGAYMKQIAVHVTSLGQSEIKNIELNGSLTFKIEDKEIHLELEDFEITAKDIPGWTVVTDGSLTVALDVEISNELRMEGIAREMVNRIQNGRKDMGLEVSDRIKLSIHTSEIIQSAISKFEKYIMEEVLANSILLLSEAPKDGAIEEIENPNDTVILIEK